ncbi:MAG: hypothetical protein JSS49_00315 [Planctomycetes bacterium]|nr:hypothetical protein [Planctomycetota bacterium]
MKSTWPFNELRDVGISLGTIIVGMTMHAPGVAAVEPQPAGGYVFSDFKGNGEDGTCVRFSKAGDGRRGALPY